MHINQALMITDSYFCSILSRINRYEQKKKDLEIEYDQLTDLM
jgi:hypothetical protein